ncbi:MAG: hypothetical protein IPJ51_03465 [Saprospiraceae bacterium]|nr:hypothetical protein [Saprospiraceae bacterium]
MPYILVGLAILLVVFNDSLGDEDGFIVFSLLFFTALTIWMVRWLIIQIKFILRLKKEKNKLN